MFPWEKSGEKSLRRKKKKVTSLVDVFGEILLYWNDKEDLRTWMEKLS